MVRNHRCVARSPSAKFKILRKRKVLKTQPVGGGCGNDCCRLDTSTGSGVGEVCDKAKLRKPTPDSEC